MKLSRNWETDDPFAPGGSCPWALVALVSCPGVLTLSHGITLRVYWSIQLLCCQVSSAVVSSFVDARMSPHVPPDGAGRLHKVSDQRADEVAVRHLRSGITCFNCSSRSAQRPLCDLLVPNFALSAAIPMGKSLERLVYVSGIERSGIRLCT